MLLWSGEVSDLYCFSDPFGIVVAIFQKSEELLEEVVLSKTLNCLRGQQDDVHNACTTFIETIEYVFCLKCSKFYFSVTT